MSEDQGSNRKETILSVIKRVSALEAERKSIGEDIRSIKQTLIKGELGMKIGDFNVAMRLYSLEGDDRDELLDTIHETFNALGMGDQLDWITASQRTQAGASVEVENETSDAETTDNETTAENQEAAE